MCVTVCVGPLSGQGVSSVASRGAALNDLFHEMWEDQLKHSPEFASSLGDRRYNDQLSDLTPRAVNDGLARDQAYLLRLEQIDTTGLSDQGEALRAIDGAAAD